MTPEAVAQAMRVLEIHDRLEHPGQNVGADPEDLAERLADNEVEVLKEMCNVRRNIMYRFSLRLKAKLLLVNL